ncbi:hypothetical protein SPI_01062 [Niveomyces insectorum RCEF 264]|uniref:Uncharacterized protein n=1 Tax=Niveomyces insectorum RCEF 264 TaxID=1081102 RepID=A0A167YMU3_9HYPO|nr:hypothetical protein SPI_01062 [Niveomyces insectorum RCEF 264]
MPSPKPEFHVPGAYHFDNPPFQTHVLGANVFLPPASPSMTSSVFNLGRSTVSLDSDVSTSVVVGRGGTPINAKRKRAAQDSRESTPAADWTAMSADISYGQAFSSNNVGMMGRSTGNRDTMEDSISYTLAGQIDTPDGPARSAVEDSYYSDVDYRRALGPKRIEGAFEAGDPQSAKVEGWTVLHTLGSVVGKVWEFCTTGAFRGFHAGGGAGYDWETSKPTMEGGDTTDAQQSRLGDAVFAGNHASAVAGHRSDVGNVGPCTGGHGAAADAAQSLDDGEQHHDLGQRYHERTRGSGKRRQVGLAGDELKRNWIMVEPEQQRQDGGKQARAPTFVRSGSRASLSNPIRTPKASRPDVTVRRFSPAVKRTGTMAVQGSRLRVSHAGSPALSPREPASFASPRSPITATRSPLGHAPYSPAVSRIPISVPGGSPASSSGVAFARPESRTGGPRRSALPMSPPMESAHRASRRGSVNKMAISLSRRNSTNGAVVENIQDSPRLDDEAKRLAAQNLAAEKNADAKIEAFNLRLKEMIRQGKEALGTTFEIDGDGEQDDFWEDDE